LWKSFLVAIIVLLTIVVVSVYTNYQGLLLLADSLEADERPQDYIEVVQNVHFDDNLQDTTNSSIPDDRIVNPAEPIKNLVEYGDFIYENDDWDAAPIIIERYKLAFFTIPKVGCTTWKQLFRRMMGYSNWATEEYVNMLPWNPQTNGLKYLYDFPLEKANEIMTSPEWTRAIFVRDPKERLVSAYLDKGVGNPNYMREKCCGKSEDCVRDASRSLESFLRVAMKCDNAHWRFVNHFLTSRHSPYLSPNILYTFSQSPQAKRIDDKYWSYINFVGRMENLADDAKRLLRQIGAWQRYGASGWGKGGKNSIFQTKAGGVGRHHATNAHDKLKETISSAELEEAIEMYYAEDYLNPVLNFTNYHLYNGNKNQGIR
jgi:hypothetical protein